MWKNKKKPLRFIVTIRTKNTKYCVFVFLTFTRVLLVNNANHFTSVYRVMAGIVKHVPSFVTEIPGFVSPKVKLAYCEDCRTPILIRLLFYNG